MTDARAMREALVALSRRYSRVAHEAEDLAHDLLLSSLRRGLPPEALLRRGAGAARHHGAFLARSAARRRARERSGVADAAEVDVVAGEGAPLSVLTQPLRTTLLLLLQGLEKAELRVALGVTDAALRKRFQALRALAPLERPRLPAPAGPFVALRRSQVAALPRWVRARPASARAVAVSDPDGHGLIFFTPEPTAATPGAPA